MSTVFWVGISVLVFAVILHEITRIWMQRRVFYLLRIDPLLGFLSQALSRGVHPEAMAEQVGCYIEAGLLNGPLASRWVARILFVVGLTITVFGIFV